MSFLEIPYLARICGPLSRDLFVIPGGCVRSCKGSCLIYFKSSLLQVSPPLLANLSLNHHRSMVFFVCMYIYIKKKKYIAYLHIYVYKINLFQAILCLLFHPDQCTHNTDAKVPAAADNLLPHSLLQALLQKSAGLNLGQRSSFPI